MMLRDVERELKMETKIKWEFDCPQYVDFRKPLDKIEESDSFFDIVHANHIKSILKKRIDERENKENVKPPENIESSTEIKLFDETRTFISDSRKNLIKQKIFEKKPKLSICSKSENKFSISNGILKSNSKIPLLERNINNIHLKNSSSKCLYNNIEEDRNKGNHKISKNIQESLRTNFVKNNENHKITVTGTKDKRDSLNLKTKLKYIPERQKNCPKIALNHLNEKGLQNKETLKVNIKSMKVPLSSKDISKKIQENNFPKIQNSINRKTVQYNQENIKYRQDSLNCKITEKKIQGNLNCSKIIQNSLNRKTIKCKNQENNKNMRDSCRMIERKIQENLKNGSKVIQHSLKSVQNKNHERTIKGMKNLSNSKTIEENIQENEKNYPKTLFSKFFSKFKEFFQNSLNKKTMQNKTQNWRRKCSQLNSNGLNSNGVTSEVQGNGKCVVCKNKLRKHDEILNYSRKTTVKAITPECLKRSQNKDLKKYIKSTEELEIEKIISLQKQLKEHCKLSKISMTKAITSQSIKPMRNNISKHKK